MNRRAFIRRMGFAALASGMLGTELLRRELSTRDYLPELPPSIASESLISYDDDGSVPLPVEGDVYTFGMRFGDEPWDELRARIGGVRVQSGVPTGHRQVDLLLEPL